MILARQNMFGKYRAVAIVSNNCLLLLCSAPDLKRTACQVHFDVKVFAPDLSEAFDLGRSRLRNDNRSLPVEMWFDERQGLLFVNSGTRFSILRKHMK